MKTHRLTRILAASLAAMMLLPMLAACAGDSGAATDTTAAPAADTSAAPAETTAPTHDAEGYLLDTLPADLDFGGEKVGILYWEDVEHPEFEVLEITGDIVNDAIFKRNETVQDRLNVEFEWYATKGNSSNRNTYFQTVQNSFNAGEKAYDIYAAYSRTLGMVAQNGYCYNLNDVDYLDFEMPWWPERMLETATIGNKLLFVSGDISTNTLHMMYGIYYNKDMITNYQMTDPTEYVLNGTWTIDKMIEMTNGLYQDLNGDGKADPNDQYGLTSLDYHNEAFHTGADLHLIIKDADKTLVLDPGYGGERAINLIDKVGAWMQTQDVLKGASATYMQTFEAGTCLFTVNRAHTAEKNLRNVDFAYGILPAPKYDENQENYITCMANPFTLYAISRDCETPDTSAAVLEAMGSAGYRMTTPAIFETNMKVKYSENDINAQMYDIVRDGVDFELGRIFGTALDYACTEYIQNAIWANSPWASTSKAVIKIATKKIEKLVEQLMEGE